MATTITKQPSPGPKNLRIERATENNGNSVKAIWGNPADALSDSNHKWEVVDGAWYFNADRDMVEKWIEQRGSQGRVTGDWVWVRDQGIHESHTVWLDPSKYYPSRVRKLLSITADIYPCNSVKGWAGTNHAKATFRVYPPSAPTITKEYDEESHEVTWEITQAKQTGGHFTYDTQWCVMRLDSPDLESGTSYKTEAMYKQWTQLRSNDEEPTTSYTLDVTAATTITPGKWIKFTAKAYSRGCGGDSPVKESVYVHAYPAQATISSITVSQMSSVGVVTVKMNTNHNANTAPVDKVVLQRLSDVTYGTARTAGLAQGWEDVAEDDGQCTGLSDPVVDAIPSAKKHTWYRVKTEHGGFTRYSEPVEAKCLYRAKDAVADDSVKFVSISPNDDSTSITCQLAWELDDSNATEISWSENEDAWESTEQPSSFVVEWEDDTTVSGYAGSCTVTVRGLDAGKPYYLRARRVQTEDDTHGSWIVPDKEFYPVSTGAAPTDVLITAPSGVPRGQGMDVTWTYTGGTQTAWRVSRVDQTESSYDTPEASQGFPHELYRYVATEDDEVKSKTYYVIANNAFVPVETPSSESLETYYETVPRKRYTLVEEEGTAGGCTIPPEVLEGISQMVIVASVTCNGDWADSNTAVVYIAEPPTIAVAVATLTAQPLPIGLSTDCAYGMVTITVSSRGVFGDSPAGSMTQAEGDVIWSTAVTPNWEVQGNLWSTTVFAPNGLDLRSGGTYDVTASVTDTQSGLCSEDATAFFTVSWAHDATCPSQDSQVIGNRDDLSASILPIAPDNAEETDVCDIYRVTPDGSYLIASDVPFGRQVVDTWAPFAADDKELVYRLCTRTADGDLDWADFEYKLKNHALRIDFGGSSIELPYNLDRNDSWQKGFEARTHLDGTTAGYWDESSMRTASFTTDLVRFDHESAELVRQLATYSGPCFVRTPEGCAFQANVDVSGLNRTYNSTAVAVSISASEVALTDEYRISPEGWEQQ